jgi:hypothetical protein
VARDIGTPMTDLDDFSRGKRELPTSVLQQLAKEFFNADFDSAPDLLVKAKNEAKPFGTARPPSIPEMGLTLPKFAGGPYVLKTPLPPLRPPAPKKPGWALSWKTETSYDGKKWHNDSGIIFATEEEAKTYVGMLIEHLRPNFTRVVECEGLPTCHLEGKRLVHT